MTLRGDLAKRQEFSPPSLLKGTLLKPTSTETEPVDGSIIFAQTLHSQSYDEDAPPLALTHGANIFLFVADGLGGSGATLIDTSTGTYSEAHLASHTLSTSFKRRLSASPEILELNTAKEEATAIESSIISPALSQLDKTFATQTSGLKGKTVRRFPTTVSTITINKSIEHTRLKCVWAGDSPIIIITPESIYTTFSPGDGDRPIENVVYTHNVHLDSQDILLSSDIPFIAVCATDALLKLPGGELLGALNLISKALVGTPRAEMQSKLQQLYNELILAGGEIDDSTIAVYINGNIDNIPNISSVKQILPSK